MAMFISLQDHGYQWYLVLFNASDLKEYQDLGPDERYKMGFKRVYGSDPKYDHLMELLEAEDKIGYGKDNDEMRHSQTHTEVLKDIGVDPLTQTQLDAGWWYCRPFSATSSSSDKLITAAAPFIDQDHPMRSHQFEVILKYTGQLSCLSGIDDNNDDDNSNTASILEISDNKVEEIVDDDISQQRERQRQSRFGEDESNDQDDESDNGNSDDETDESEGNSKKELLLAEDESEESNDACDDDASVETLWSLSNGKDKDGDEMSSQDEVNHDESPEDPADDT